MKKKININQQKKYLNKRINYLNIYKLTSILIMLTIFIIMSFDILNFYTELFNIKLGLNILFILFFIQTIIIYFVNKMNNKIINKKIHLPEEYILTTSIFLFILFFCFLFNTGTNKYFFLFLSISLILSEFTKLIFINNYINYELTLINYFKNNEPLHKHFKNFTFNKNISNQLLTLQKIKDLYIEEKIKIIKQKHGEYWFLMDFNRFKHLNENRLKELQNKYEDLFNDLKNNLITIYI